MCKPCFLQLYNFPAMITIKKSPGNIKLLKAADFQHNLCMYMHMPNQLCDIALLFLNITKIMCP